MSDEEQRILRSPLQGEASDFYWACQKGDALRVKELLAGMTLGDINQLERNGSTPLHAASYYGHAEIVRLLLHERDCLRGQVNRHGLTAYEEAQTEEIRGLFRRPGGVHRFCDGEDTTIASNVFEVETENKQADDDDSDIDEEFKGDHWLEGCPTPKQHKDIQRTLRTLKTCMQSKMFTTLASKMKLMENFNKLIAEHIATNSKDFEKCTLLVKKAVENDQIEPLIRLYTLQTPFYRAMAEKKNAMVLYFPLMVSLDKLQARFFRGVSYRGARMTDHSLYAYRWSLKYKHTIMSKTFCSTSIDRAVAEMYAPSSSTLTRKRNVLLIFSFSNNCESAIHLSKLSNDLPCISEYEDEEEVLILPYTLFIVRQIETNPNYVIIHLDNIFVKPKSWLSSIKFVGGAFIRSFTEL